MSNQKSRRRTIRPSIAISNLAVNSDTSKDVELNQDPPNSGEHHEDAETQLTNEKLIRLQRVFEEADEDGGGGLDMDEFRIAMRQTLGNNLSDEEMDIIFMKVDTNCDGTVDWDEYLTYMLLECREKDQMQVDALKPFPRDIHVHETCNRDMIVRIQFLPSKAPVSVTDSVKQPHINYKHGRYVTTSKDGYISMWSQDFSSNVTKCVEPPAPYKKPIWVTDTTLIPSANLIAVATTSRVLMFYDITRNRFERLIKLTSLPTCPVKLGHWASCGGSIPSLVYWGDDVGGVYILKLRRCILMTQINPRRRKDGRDSFEFSQLIDGEIEGIECQILPNAHNDCIQHVTYSAHLGCLVSCSRNTDTAMLIYDLQNAQLGKMNYCVVEKGINSFDYSPELNIICTGGYDAIVRVWNPYVYSKPTVLLRGHKRPINHIMINPCREHVISLSENKEIRIHDLTTQTCMQTYFRKTLVDLGGRPLSAAFFNPFRQVLVFATTKIATLQPREEALKTLWTHETAVTVTLYNPLFKQVVSASIDSVVCVWDVFTGQKVMQYFAHRIYRNGYIENVEITAMSFDPTYRRLITAARNGSVKIWNFNNGACLRDIPVPDTSEVTSIVCPKGRIAIGGWNKEVSLILDTSDDDTINPLSPTLKHDILTMAYNNQNLLACGSCEGNVMVWSLETYNLVFYSNTWGSGRPTSPSVLEALFLRDARKEIGDNRSSPWENNEKNIQRAVHKLVFLPHRKNNPETASLFGGCADGKVYAWSVHHYGGLIKKFPAIHKNASTLTTIEVTPDNEFLVVADDMGYIRVWDVTHYCMSGTTCDLETDMERMPMWEKFAYFRFIRSNSLRQLNNENNDSIENQTNCHMSHHDPQLPHLVNSFRAHTMTISCLDVNQVGENIIVLSSSPDRSVRMWSLAGELYGIFGHQSLWRNLRHLDRPIPHTLNKMLTQTTILPPDLRRVASPLSLRVYYGKASLFWRVARIILTWISTWRHFSHDKTDTETPEFFIQGTESLSGGVESAISKLKTFEGARESVLGKAYKKTAGHKPMPTVATTGRCALQNSVYAKLPYNEIDDLRLNSICDMNALSQIQKSHNLPALDGNVLLKHAKNTAKYAIKAGKRLTRKSIIDREKNTSSMAMLRKVSMQPRHSIFLKKQQMNAGKMKQQPRLVLSQISSGGELSSSNLPSQAEVSWSGEGMAQASSQSTVLHEPSAQTEYREHRNPNNSNREHTIQHTVSTEYRGGSSDIVKLPPINEK